MKAAFMLVDMYRWVTNLTKSDLFLEKKEYVITQEELAKTLASAKPNYNHFVLSKRLEHTAFDHPEIAEPLLNAIAALDIKEQSAIFAQNNELGFNALMLAVSQGFTMTVEKLSKKIDPGAAANGLTAMFMAAQKGHFDIVQCNKKGRSVS